MINALHIFIVFQTIYERHHLLFLLFCKFYRIKWNSRKFTAHNLNTSVFKCLGHSAKIFVAAV